VLIDGEKCGIIGALSPKITKELSLNKSFVFEIDLSKILIKNNIKYQQFSIYQSSSRDISMLFDKKISYDEIITSINSLKQKNLIEIKLVDVWSGDDIENDKHSLTISLSYQAQDKTLTDEEIDNPVKKIVKLLTKEYNAEQR
jgi:phenylalanyl-tRNA synthetase beta chain